MAENKANEEYEQLADAAAEELMRIHGGNREYLNLARDDQPVLGSRDGLHGHRSRTGQRGFAGPGVQDPPGRFNRTSPPRIRSMVGAGLV